MTLSIWLGSISKLGQGNKTVPGSFRGEGAFLRGWGRPSLRGTWGPPRAVGAPFPCWMGCDGAPPAPSAPGSAGFLPRLKN